MTTNGMRHLSAMLVVAADMLRHDFGDFGVCPRSEGEGVFMYLGGGIAQSLTIEWYWHPTLGPVVTVRIEAFTSGAAKRYPRG